MADHDPYGPAVGVIVRQLARARDQEADDDFTARAILQALMARGWRQAIEPPPVQATAAVPPTDEWKAARAAIQPPAP